MDASITISRKQYREMHDHVNHHFPDEACGILAGIGGETSQIYPITNELHSRSRFRMDPIELLHVLEEIDDSDDEIIGIFHSHPTGPDHPSSTDIEEAYYPDAVHLIWCIIKSVWICKAYQIAEGSFTEIDLFIRNNSHT